MPLKRQDAAEFRKRAKAQGISDELTEAAIRQMGGEEPSAEATQAARAGLIKAADYSGGVVRAGVGVGIEAATGKDLGVNFWDTLTGKTGAPGTAEMLDRAGVGEMGRMSNIPLLGNIYAEKGTGSFIRPEAGGSLDFTGRGVVGFAGDTLAEVPGALITGGAGALAKGGGKLLTKGGAALQKKLPNSVVAEVTGKGAELAGRGLAASSPFVAAPLSSTLRGTGSKMYEWGIAPAEAEARLYGKQNLTPILKSEKVYAAPWRGTISEQMDELGEKYLAQTAGMLEGAGRAGAKSDLKTAMLGPLAEAKRLRKSFPGVKNYTDRADLIEEKAKELIGLDERAGFSPLKLQKGTPEGPVDFGTGLRTPAVPDRLVPDGPTIPDQRARTGHEIRELKSDEAKNLPQGAFKDMKVSQAQESASEVLHPALLKEERAFVERGLGQEGLKKYVDTQEKLGTILTTKERQAMHEANKSKQIPVTQTKIGAALSYMPAAAGMYLGQAMERSLTPAGYFIDWLGQPKKYMPAPVNEAAWRQVILNNERPEGL